MVGGPFGGRPAVSPKHGGSLTRTRLPDLARASCASRLTGAAYNALHAAIRVRGFALGWEAGTSVGSRLRGLDLAGRAERTAVLTLVLVGVVAGVLLTADRGVGALEWRWFAAALGAFCVGFVGGVRLWRPTAIVTVGVVAVLLAIGSTSLLSG